MKKNASFLLKLNNAKTAGEQKAVVKKCTVPEITTLAEVSKNVLGNRIKVSPQQKVVLCRHKRGLRMLASRKVSAQEKKRNIIKGRFLVPLSILASAAIPYVVKLFSKKKDKGVRGGRVVKRRVGRKPRKRRAGR
jgi:hypothetical protein